MKLQITLISTFITLFINNAYAISPDAADCNKAYGQGDIATATTAANKALGINKNDRDALICQGRILSAKDDLNGALASFQAADAFSTDAFDKTVIALVTGHAYKASNQPAPAIASYQQVIQHAKLAKHKGFERMGYMAIGDIHYYGKQYEAALGAYLAGSQLDNNDNERGESYEKIAVTYHTTNQHELALEYQVKAFLMHEISGTLDQYAHSSVELGRYYANVKDYAAAEKALNKIIKFAKERGGAYFEAQGSYVLAQVKVATGDVPAAKALVEHAKSIAKNTNDKALEVEIDQATLGLFK